MITSALHRAADWAKSVFSSAALGDPRRTTRLVNVAAQLAQQCQGRCGEVQAIATAATGLACFIFRFLRRPQFKQPLPANEVRHTAKSIAKWTHQHLSPTGFREEQARRGAKGGKVSKGGGRPSNAEALLPEVLRLKALGYTNRDIADDLQISAGSVSNYLRRERA